MRPWTCGSSSSPSRGDLRRPAAGRPAAEDAGFDAFFRSDHFLAMVSRRARADRLVGDAGRAGAETSRIRLGRWSRRRPSASPGRWRSGGEVDQMSAGGSSRPGHGWFQAEHAAYGIPFPASASGSTGWPSSWSVTGLWRRRGSARSPAALAGTRPPPNRCSSRTRRDRRWQGQAHPSWPPGSPPSSTSRSRRWTRLAQFRRVDAPARRSGATGGLIRSVAQTTFVGRDDGWPAGRRRSARSPTSSTRSTSRAPWRRSSTSSGRGGSGPASPASTCRSSTWPTSTRSS